MKVFQKIKSIPKRLYRRLERNYYKKGSYSKKLNILNTEETLELLENEKISFLRYGDGEIAIIQGNSIPFQEFDNELSRQLKELLNVSDNTLKVGIPYYYMTPLTNLNPFVEKFADSLAVQRRLLINECRNKNTYIDTAITQVYQTYGEYDFENYYNRMQSLLKGKNITIVCGEGVLDKLEYKAFDVCETVEFVYAPKVNAYSEYSVIYNKVLKTDKDRLVCAVLGPTAKVLVYDLYKSGYQAWDMGHYFKDYDAYMRNQPRNAETISLFYKPD